MPRKPAKLKKVEEAKQAAQGPVKAIALDLPIGVLTELIAQRLGGKLAGIGYATDPGPSVGDAPDTRNAYPRTALQGQAARQAATAAPPTQSEQTAMGLTKQLCAIAEKLHVRLGTLEDVMFGGRAPEALGPAEAGLNGSLRWAISVLEAAHGIVSRIGDYTGIEA
jgi:hypothetical protein